MGKISLVSALKVGTLLSRHKIQSEIGPDGPNFKAVSYRIKTNASGLEAFEQYKVIKSLT